MNEFDPWRYQARLDRVVDGDTIDLVVDLGFGIQRDMRVRLIGIDTAEIYGVPEGSEEMKLGARHHRFVKQWFREAAELRNPWRLMIRTHKDRTGKYGRYLADVYAKRGIIDDEAWPYEVGLAESLIEEFGEEVRSDA